MKTMEQHREEIMNLLDMTGLPLTPESIDRVSASVVKSIKASLAHGNTTDAAIQEQKDMIAECAILKRELRET